MLTKRVIVYHDGLRQEQDITHIWDSSFFLISKMFVMGSLSVPILVTFFYLNSCAVVRGHNQSSKYSDKNQNRQLKVAPPNFQHPNLQNPNSQSQRGHPNPQHPHNHHLKNISGDKHFLELRDNSGAASHHGWSTSGDYGQQHHYHHQHSHAPQQGWGWNDQNNKGGHDFRSYFDMALTALAFLSFGTFLLNLLLNALLYAGLVTSTGTGTGDDDGRRRSRPKRATFEFSLDPATAMDSLAHSVLKSIDAMIHKHECVGQIFCEGNRHAKVVGSGFQYLMPLYSLSASYMGKKFGLHDHLLDHLNAVILGVGESNCHDYFPHC